MGVKLMGIFLVLMMIFSSFEVTHANECSLFGTKQGCEAQPYSHSEFMETSHESDAGTHAPCAIHCAHHVACFLSRPSLKITPILSRLYVATYLFAFEPAELEGPFRPPQA